MPSTPDTVPLDDDAVRRLAAVERVACAMSHEINNMLTVVLAHAGLIQLDPSPANVDRHAAAVELAASHAAALAADLRELTGQAGGLRTKEVLVGPVVAELPVLLGPLAGDAWRCSVAPADGCAVLAERGRLEHVVVLMVSEVRARFPGGGQLHVACRTDRLDSGHPAVVLSVAARPHPAASPAESRHQDHVDPVRIALLHRAAQRNGGQLRVIQTPESLLLEAIFPEKSNPTAATASGSP